MKKLTLFVILSALILASCSPLPQPAQRAPLLATTPAMRYMLERVPVSDFVKVAGWGITHVINSFDVNGSPAKWRETLAAAEANGLKVVIIPSDWTHPRGPDSVCNWESPFPVTVDGDISRITNLLTVAAEYPSFVGIMSAHEFYWTCKMTVQEMTGIKTKIKDFLAAKGRADVQVWNYIGGSVSVDPAKLAPADYAKITDVAVIWKHCAGNAEGLCSDTPGMLAKARANAVGVELVYLIQTFTIAGTKYQYRFTLDQLKNNACTYIGTNTLDGFGFYTWAASWWPDLSEWPEMWPAIPYIHDNCINNAPPQTLTPAPATSTPTSTPPTSTRTPAPATKTPTPKPPCTTIYTDITKGFALQICSLP